MSCSGIKSNSYWLLKFRLLFVTFLYSSFAPIFEPSYLCGEKCNMWGICCFPIKYGWLPLKLYFNATKIKRDSRKFQSTQCYLILIQVYEMYVILQSILYHNTPTSSKNLSVNNFRIDIFLSRKQYLQYRESSIQIFRAFTPKKQ